MADSKSRIFLPADNPSRTCYKQLFYFFLFVCVAVIANAQAKYVFYFIGDGMGVNQVNGTEMYRA